MVMCQRSCRLSHDFISQVLSAASQPRHIALPASSPIPFALSPIVVQFLRSYIAHQSSGGLFFLCLSTALEETCYTWPIAYVYS